MLLGYFFGPSLGTWLLAAGLIVFFIVVKSVLYVDMDESIAFENCSEHVMAP